MEVLDYKRAVTNDKGLIPKGTNNRGKGCRGDCKGDRREILEEAFLPPQCWKAKVQKYGWHGTICLQDLFSPGNSFLLLFVLNPFPVKSWKKERERAAWPFEVHRAPKASCPVIKVRRADPWSQGPWEFSFTSSPASVRLFYMFI